MGLYAFPWLGQQVSLPITASMGLAILTDPEWEYLKVLRALPGSLPAFCLDRDKH